MAMGECLNPQPDCKYETPFSNQHHLYYPACEYQTRIEKSFRNLLVNVVQICACEHENIHATQEPPIKPSRDSMLDAIATETM